MYIKILFLQLFSLILFAEHLITPVPLENSYNKHKALLGKELFFEKKLSPNKNFSCIDCHKLSKGGADDDALSSLHNNTKTTSFNAPTVFNAMYSYKLFWDGRVNNLKDQINDSLGSFILNKDDKILFMKSLSSTYEKKFQQTYIDGFIYENVIDSLVEFLKALSTQNASFDKYLRGDKKALNYKELIGYEIFKSRGCISCHNGVNLGSNSYSKLNIFHDEYHAYRGCFNKTVHKKEFTFVKVPSLRNVSITGPYFHDGRIEKLEDAIQSASIHALKRKLTTNEITSLVFFLKTLTGEKPKILRKIVDNS